MSTVKGVDVTWLNTIGHGDIESLVWRTGAIEAAAKAIDEAAGELDSQPGMVAIPIPLLRALREALQ